MRRGVIFGREVAMQGSVWAMAEYRREFHADLLADAAAAYGEGRADVCAMLQIAWAMARAADGSTSPYTEWLREFDPRLFALGDAAGAVGVIDSAISAELFRVGAAGRARRWLAGRVGSLAQRLGARADGLLP